MKNYKLIFVDEAGFGTKRLKTIKAKSETVARDIAGRMALEFNVNLIEVTEGK